MHESSAAVSVVDRVSWLEEQAEASARAPEPRTWKVLVVDDEPDLPVVLLDVVMETPDAGLRLVRRVRDELGRKALRIVLRT